MYLRLPQLTADIHLQRAWKKLPFYPAPKQRLRKIPECIFQESRPPLSPGFESVLEEVLNVSRGRYSTRAARRGAVGHGRWTNQISCTCCFRRSFATSTLWRKRRWKTFMKEPYDEMATIGAARESFYFQLVTTPTSDTPGTSLLLHFNSKRYLFGNISEGSQRAFVHRGVTLKKVRNIFLTGKVSWRNTGGLIGMILTLADVQAAEREPEKQRKIESAKEQKLASTQEALTIHGGEKVLHTMACARRFVFRQGMPVSVNEFKFEKQPNLEQPTWKDENIRVWAMAIAPSESNRSSDDDVRSSAANPSSKKQKRSHDQGGAGEVFAPKSPERHLQQDELRQRIVFEMFSSKWNRDTLFETPLAHVKTPAAIFVRDPETHKIVSYGGPRPGGDESVPDIKVLVRNPWPSALIEELPPARDIGFQPAMSYIVQGYPQRGRFDPKKASDLGVPKGRDYSSLAAGNSVILDNGNVITPEMVLGPRKLGRGIAIVELPSRDYVENLVTRPEWTSEQIRNGIAAICWILGPTVVDSPELKDFMNSMPKVEHVISSTDVCPNYLAFDASAASAIRLSRISNRCFPVLVHDNATLPQIGSGNLHPVQLSTGFTAANRGLIIQIEPSFVMKTDKIPPTLDTALVVNSLPPTVQQLAHSARDQVAADIDPALASDPSTHSEASKFDPQIITLGTGSSSPSKYRNVSATLLRTEKYGNFLFDCGENTLGQLRRLFAPPSLVDILRNLKFIWISHLHADHHLGTISVLDARRTAWLPNAQEMGQEAEIPCPPTVVASESKMQRFLEEYGSVESLPKMRQLFCHPFQGPILDEEMARFLHQQLGIKNLQTTAVEHCSGAQAISVTFENGFKFSYSGDCRPSVPFARIGKGSDVLVHEATFDDDMQGDALAKKHCTVGEALGVAVEMQAKNVILTHFSQRYQKLPVMQNIKLPSSTEVFAQGSSEDLPPLVEEIDEVLPVSEDRSTTTDPELVVQKKTLLKMAGLDAPVSNVPKLDMNICVAFDYMSVRVSDIKHMEKFTPAFTALFEVEQTKSIDGSADPGERHEVIKRGKGSKKLQQPTDSKENGSPVTGVDRKAPRSHRNSQGGNDQDKKLDTEQSDDLTSRVPSPPQGPGGHLHVIQAPDIQTHTAR